MSFDLCFWWEKASSTPERAAEIYDQLTDGDTGVVESATAVDDFFVEIVELFGDLTEENIKDSPWMSPVYRTPECVIVAIAWSRREDVGNALFGIANKHGLTVYDPQEQKVHQSAE